MASETELHKPDSLISLENTITPLPLLFAIQALNHRIDHQQYREPYTDEHAIRVGWGMVDILPANSSQNMIHTRGVSSCYVICGISTQGDIILGHHFVDDDLREVVMPLIEERLNSYNATKLRKNNFTFFAIPGPDNPEGLDLRFQQYDISLIRNPLSLEIIAYNTRQ